MYEKQTNHSKNTQLCILIYYLYIIYIFLYGSYNRNPFFFSFLVVYKNNYSTP